MMLDAVVIGAGFSGLYQLFCLRENLGLNVKLLEAGEGVGGTWYWNRYPGARCDSESHVYCYTFSKSLTEEWNWSERYPGPTEIVDYLNHVTDRFDLRRSIEFGIRVVSARFNEEDSCWDIETASGQYYRARFLITAVGCLSSANVPEIDGLEDFQGEWYHTGQWPHDGVQFEGKRVGQIGTGSTGIQAAPVIAKTAQHLTVFQRTANFSVPARNHELTAEDRNAHKRNAAETRELTRGNSNGHCWLISDQKALETSAEDRAALYEKAWETGGLKFRSTFSDLLSSEEANSTAADFIRKKIGELVEHPDTASALSDIDHPYAAKRPPIDTRYFETYNQKNVELVDLKKTPITKITKSGIICRGADSRGQECETHYDLDVLVFATGYDAITGTLLRLDIRGRKQQKLSDAWSAGPRNHLGLQVAGFPNLFMITGPGSPSVLTNMPSAIEQHVEWISNCIAYMKEQEYTLIESPESSVESWVSETNAEADKTLLPKVKHSWYLGANIPGKPRVFMPYAGGLDKYRDICQKVADDNYQGFDIS
ncbi:MAG: cation diffusion facilitator CzcD-associated flavoprotein CzcO [Granulosicoccus sp.]|jgi:cation diffusion facilitator CzcD-associated flavoprotein CzcO